MASAGETFAAELCDVAGDTIGLKKPDGQVVRLPPGTLNAADQRFIRHSEAVATSTPAVFGEAREGVCFFKPGEEFDPGPLLAQEGRTIAGACRFSIEDALGRKVIAAKFSLSTTAPGIRHCRYYMAFFDKDDVLLGCKWQVMQDRTVAYGAAPEFTPGGWIRLPAGMHEAAVRYRLTGYESDRKIGSEGLQAATAAELHRRRGRSAAQHASGGRPAAGRLAPRGPGDGAGWVRSPAGMP